ncbi:nucleic-acid-binding protein from transposon X-element [Trichonephila clavipes]|nr:nucleic-acid-binding protein from transposon X-element [Trichonephila clavipes]
MTSSTDWSERTVDTEHQPPNSPSRVIAGDDHIAECSDLFREAIKARNVYAAWARKLTNARPNDPMMQSYHQEVTKAGRGACRDEKATHPAVLRLSQGRLRQLVALAKLIAPSFQSQMSGRFLKVTVADDVDYRALSKWLESSGVEFKSFMLKQDRPVKVVIRGLPSNTEPEEIKAEIETEGFQVLKISQMKNFRTKAPMPLFYLQIQNGADAAKIYDFTELFGTRIEVKPFDRGNKINQCWRCQGWFHSSEVCHLPPRCVKCAGPHAAKDCTLDFNDPMNNSAKNLNKKQPAQAPRPDISKARKVSPNLDYSKVVQNKIPKEHVSPPSTSKSELRPAPSKDASINAGLLKDLLEVIEESPSIDKQTFCRAFKNSLSALRSASADVDKTYVIFEAYCRLRSLQA